MQFFAQKHIQEKMAKQSRQKIGGFRGKIQFCQKKRCLVWDVVVQKKLSTKRVVVSGLFQAAIVGLFPLGFPRFNFAPIINFILQCILRRIPTLHAERH